MIRDAKDRTDVDAFCRAHWPRLVAGPSVGEPAHNVGEVLEFEPVDVGLPLNSVFMPLPDDTVVTAVEALDANGEVLDTADGDAGIPD